MKKLVPCILIICLIIGVPLMVMDALSKESNFKIPKAYEKIEIDLGEKLRDNEIIFTKTFEAPKQIHLFIQSDSPEEKRVTLISEKKVIGHEGNSYSYVIPKVIDNSSISPSLLLDSGTFSISLSNVKSKGKLVIGYQENVANKADFERLKKIDSGELNNPPPGYEKVFNCDLSGKHYTKETIYKITLDSPLEIGLSAYTNSKKGTVSTDLVGKQSDWSGLIHSNYTSICDQFTQTLSAGEYEIKLSSENADGQLYVFIKK